MPIELKAGLQVLPFADLAAFEAWLAVQPRDARGLWVMFAKQGSGLASVSKSDAIDAALCHGWIDGQLEKYDTVHWLVRFTPRRPNSKWSEINCKRAEALIAAGRMQAGGQAQIDAAKADCRWAAAYAPASSASVPADLQAALDAQPLAAKFFATLTGANRYAILYRIGTVKTAATRARKISEYVSMLARGETLH